MTAMKVKTEFVQLMLDRTRVIRKMSRLALPLDFLREFSLTELEASCDRIECCLSGTKIVNPDVKRELVMDPAFAGWLAEFMRLLPEEKPEGLSEEGEDKEPQKQEDSETVPEICREDYLERLYNLISACQENGENISVFSAENVKAAVEIKCLTSQKHLVYLKNFVELEQDKEVRKTVGLSLQNCEKIPPMLTQRQKEILLMPSTGSRYLFFDKPFKDVCAFLELHPALLDILHLFHERAVDEALTMEDYAVMTENTTEYYRLLCAIMDRLKADAAELAVSYWKRGGCGLPELRRVDRWLSTHPGQDWGDLIVSYSCYINCIYGSRYQKIDLSGIDTYQENLLIYAIIHNKKHFIQLVDDCAETFLALPRDSVLFQNSFYQERFNLNELTERNLRDCAQMRNFQVKLDWLADGRTYTFTELQALLGEGREYVKLYDSLKADRQDYRLKVFRQLTKRKVLRKYITDQEIASLAECLDRKPLWDWLQEEFAHIERLTVEMAAQMLAHDGELRRFYPSMKTKADALLLLRNLDELARFRSLDDLKNHIVQVDRDWKALSEKMELSEEFTEVYWENIEQFICQNGAFIAETYRCKLGREEADAFLRVVKAELMGQLKKLKYYEGDLQRELGIPLELDDVRKWKCNLKNQDDNMDAKEYDDFFSTMLLGNQPYSTCIAYDSGDYRDCLLSSFDSNKKVLYVRLDGKIVGRALLRLTKGCLTKSDGRDTSGYGYSDRKFTFADLELSKDQEFQKMAESEHLTLFLERPYISGTTPEETKKVKRMLIDLARDKADLMKMGLVLSGDYGDSYDEEFVQTQFNIYISRSKAGHQYLDSLGGEALVYNEGKYKTNTFLVRNRFIK